MIRPKKMAALCTKTEAATEILLNNHHSRPIWASIQLRGIAGFEKLRAEWIAANAEHSELELLTACIGFAKLCGLALREKVLEASINELRGRYER